MNHSARPIVCISFYLSDRTHFSKQLSGHSLKGIHLFVKWNAWTENIPSVAKTKVIYLDTKSRCHIYSPESQQCRPVIWDMFLVWTDSLSYKTVASFQVGPYCHTVSIDEELKLLLYNFMPMKKFRCVYSIMQSLSKVTFDLI